MSEENPRALTAEEIAELLCGTLENAEQVRIAKVMDALGADQDSAAFLSSDHLNKLSDCAAGLLLVDEHAEVGGRACVRVENPALAATFLQQQFFNVI